MDRLIRTVLVDDQALVRAGLRLILNAHEGFEVVGEADDGADVVAVVRRTGPDLVVLDVRMRRVDGVGALRALHDEGLSPPVLVLTTFDDDEALAGALRHGANGFTFKDAPADDLILAARTVARGGAWLHPAVTARVLRGDGLRPARPSEALARLTEREREILAALGGGASNAEIARTLGISEATVKTHLSRGIFPKIGAETRTQAVVFAYDHGLVRPREE